MPELQGDFYEAHCSLQEAQQLQVNNLQESANGHMEGLYGRLINELIDDDLIARNHMSKLSATRKVLLVTFLLNLGNPAEF